MLRSRFFWLCIGATTLGVGIWGFTQRNEWLAWYAARRLATAPEAERGEWIVSLSQRGPTAVEALLPYLQSDDADACGNCGAGLAELTRQWGPTSPNTRLAVQQLAGEFNSLPTSGQQQTLFIAAAAFTPINEESPPLALVAILEKLLATPEPLSVADVRPGALLFAIRFVNQVRPAPESVIKTCRALAATGLSDLRPACRADAVRLAAAPGVDMLDQVRPLVIGASPDPAAEVRRTALVLIAANEQLASVDDLLPLLHDASAEVGVVCEKALRGRGLTEAQIELGKLMTHPQPTVRAQVPARVVEFPDLDTRVWLDRLSRDPSPAVRAALVRTVGEARDMRMRDRVREMAGNDPSPTVRELADYYLTQRHGK
jgi:hypothetical protein